MAPPFPAALLIWNVHPSKTTPRGGVSYGDRAPVAFAARVGEVARPHDARGGCERDGPATGCG